MSGPYDAYYPTPSYGYNYGDSWRPSEPQATYERPHQFPTRRRSPSPARRFRPYDGYYAADNNYRPNYRPDDDSPYHNGSQTPDRYGARVAEQDNWERSSPWSGPSKTASWQENALTSPVSSVGRVRSDSMLATRMFEPSAAWKQTHPERLVRPDVSRGHPDYQSFPSTSPQRRDRSTPPSGGDRYRPGPAYGSGRPDTYRPGWSSPVARRRTSGPLDQSGRRVSGAGSTGSSSVSSRVRPRSPVYHDPQGRRSRSCSRRSVSRGRRSVGISSSRSRSRSRSRRSRSRDRSPDRRSRSRDFRFSQSPGRRSRSRSRGRSRWSNSRSRSRGSSCSGRGRRSSRAVGASLRIAKGVNGKDATRGRPVSRSSIASSIASSRRSSPPPTLQQPLPTQPAAGSQPMANTIAIKPMASVKTDVIDVEMASPSRPQPAAGTHSILEPDTTAQVIDVKPPLVPSSQIPPEAPDEANIVVKVVSIDPQPDAPTEKPQESASRQPPVKALLSPPAETPRSDSSAHDIAAGETPGSQQTSQAESFAETEKLLIEVEELVPFAEIHPASLPTPVPTPKPPPHPRPEDIPDRSEAKSRADFLRIVVMTRMLCDRQTRDQLVDPILKTNQATASLSRDTRPVSTPEEVIKNITEGDRAEAKHKVFDKVRGSLVDRFRARQVTLTEKTERLRKEYLVLHERWLAHCAALDEQSRPPPPEAEPIQTSGRTTRRSTANLGDAVRSDLEMEQIIASLGVDDATDPSCLSLRNLAVIPDMISVTHGRVDYSFDDTNHLVLDPVEYYGPATGIHDWTDAEKEIFLDKFAAHPKQFGVVAAHIPNKTAAQCVDYYYLHKKRLIDFRKVVSQHAPGKRRRRGTGKKKGNGLLADIRQHDAEVHRDSGSPSAVNASINGRPTRGKRTPLAPPEQKEKEGKRNVSSARKRFAPQVEEGISVGSETPTPEPETRRRRRITAVPTSRTASVTFEDAEEEAVQEEIERPAKRAKRAPRKQIKSAAIVNEDGMTPEPGAEPNETSTTNRRKSQTTSVLWSDEDKKVFLTLLAQHGDDFKRIAASMPNKTMVQVSNYYKANVVELNLEQVATRAPKRSPTPERVSSVVIESLATSVPHPPQPNGEANHHYITHDPQARPPPSAIHVTHPPPPPGHMHGYPIAYPPRNRPGIYVTNHVAIPPYPSPQVPYTYPPYSDPMYPPYDARLGPIPSMPMGGAHRMPPSLPGRSRENPYPVLSPQQPTSYSYSLES